MSTNIFFSPDSEFWTKLNTIRQSYSTEQAQAPDNLPLSLWTCSSKSKGAPAKRLSLSSIRYCSSGYRRANALKARLKDEAKSKIFTPSTQPIPEQQFLGTLCLPDTLPVLKQYAPQFRLTAVLPAAAAPNQSALPAHRLIDTKQC